MKARCLMLAGAAIAALASTTATWSADLPGKAPSMLSPVSAVNWTGFYAGGHIGYLHARATLSDPTAPGISSTQTLKGFLGGAQVGYNYQAGAWVFGVEADISGSNADGSTTVRDPVTADISRSVNKVRWTSLVTARFGYAVNSALVYVKGGAAFAGSRLDAEDLTAGSSASANFTKAGWTVGTGLEYAVAGPWSVRLEYDYLNLGTKTLTLSDNTGASTQVAVKQTMHQIKTGLNYRF